jgi:hypothetical protein
MVRTYRVTYYALPNDYGYGGSGPHVDLIVAYSAADAVTQVHLRRGDAYRVTDVEPHEPYGVREWSRSHG